MTTISNSDLQSYLDRFVTPKTFLVFSKLYSLTNVDNFKRIMSMLYLRQINLSQLANMSILDDQAIQDFFDLYDRINTSTDTSGTPTTFNARQWLLGTDSQPTPLMSFYSGYSDWLNTTMYDELVPLKTVSAPYVEYGLANGSIYDNETSFKEEFYQKVTSSLLATHNVTDVSALLPSWTIDPSITGRSATVLKAVWAYLMEPFATFNNDQLASFIVDYSGNSSTFSDNLVFFHSLINYQPYSKLLDDYLTSRIFELNIKGRGYNNTELAVYADDVVTTTNSDNISKYNLTDLFTYLFFENKVALTYKANNGLALTSPYGDTLVTFQGVIAQLTSLFNEVLALVTNTLQVKV